MSMTVETLEVGQLMANCYLVGCERTMHGVIIDPGGDADLIVDAVRKAGLVIDYIIDTHCHPDHIAANCDVREKLGEIQNPAPKLVAHEAARPHIEEPPMQWLLLNMRPDRCVVDGSLAEGEELAAGDLVIKVMHLPGHSPGSIALVSGEVAFTGDTLFAGGIGRTDLPGGDYAQIMASLKRLVTELDPGTVIYPGHGPSSTIGEELATNGWLEGMS